MSTSTLTLTDFLLARIAEDEGVARDAYGLKWRLELGGAILAEAEAESGMIADYTQPADGKHITRHDPARALAECEAKRRIVDLHEPGGGAWCTSTCESERPNGCDTLRVLTLPYADHEDFREEWKP